MAAVLEEVSTLPQAAVSRARGITWIKPPAHLAERVPQVRTKHGGALAAVHGAIDRQLSDQSVGGERGALYAASELAVIAEVFHEELTGSDMAQLRAPWEHLLAA